MTRWVPGAAPYRNIAANPTSWDRLISSPLHPSTLRATSSSPDSVIPNSSGSSDPMEIPTPAAYNRRAGCSSSDSTVRDVARDR